VLLKSLPFRDASRLVAIAESPPTVAELGAPIPDFRDWQAQSQSFDGLAAYGFADAFNPTLTGRGDPEQLRGAVVSQNLFPVLGISPVIGRNFLPGEDQPGHGAVAILSGEIWKSRFGADPSVIGQSIALDGTSYTIVGVLPPGVRFPQNADVWEPTSNLPDAERTSRVHHLLFGIGRLRPGVTVAEARAEMTAIAAHLSAEYPATNRNFSVAVTPLQEKYVGGLRRALIVLWCAVGLILLIACANVASLLLARAASREGEMAVRAALGASRSRLVRQGLIESLVLSAAGAAMGVALAWLVLPVLSQWMPQVLDAPILRVNAIRIDLRTLFVTAGIALFSAVLFGILPALRAGRGDANVALRPGGRASAGAGRRHAHHLLVAAEVTLAVIVLASAGLLVRSLQKLFATSPGFRSDHVLTMRISLPANKYNPSGNAIFDFYQRLLPNLRALPGVEDAATIDRTPLIPNTQLTRFLLEGQTPLHPGEFPAAHFRTVSISYFQAMGIPQIAGREFTDYDVTRTDNGVLLINQAFARQFLAGRDPLDQKILLGVMTPQPAAVPIVGVVGDVRDLSIDAPAPPEMYFPGYTPNETLVVRSALDPASMTKSIRDAVLGVDSTQPVYEVRSAGQLLDDSMARQRFSAALLGLFSLLALVLAASGIYGVTAYGVGERTREIGVRLALGAQPADVLRLIVRQEMRVTLIGLLIGLAGGLTATRFLSGLLYGVSAADPLTYAGVGLLLAAAALAACYIPARRATRVDPMVALRYE
jgi:predicted permease